MKQPMLGCLKICDYLVQHKVGAIRLELGRHVCWTSMLQKSFCVERIFSLDTCASRKTFVWKVRLLTLPYKWKNTMIEACLWIESLDDQKSWNWRHVSIFWVLMHYNQKEKNMRGIVLLCSLFLRAFVQKAPSLYMYSCSLRKELILLEDCINLLEHVW